MKYIPNAFYTGNVMIYKNGESIQIEEGALLVYNESADKFEYFNEIYYPSMNLLTLKLKDKEKEREMALIDKYTLPYTNPLIEEALYVDESSIKPFNNTKKRG